MTAALTSDFSHYQYSGYSCAGRASEYGGRTGRRPSGALAARPSSRSQRVAQPFDVRLPRRLTAPVRRAAVRPRAVRPCAVRPCAADRAVVAVVHVRRRVVAALAFTGTMLLLWLGAGTVLANRGDDPASVSSVRPGATHTAAPGESLWTIAEQHRGATDIVVYVEQLIDLNGGEAGIQVGQRVQLP